MKQNSKKLGKTSKGGSNLEKGILVAAGIVAVTAAVAGTYFLYGSKNAAKNRKQVKGWMLKAKGEILEQLESLPEVTEEIYKKVIKEVIGRYKDLKQIKASEVKEFSSELHSHWKDIKAEVAKAVKNAKK